MLVLASQSPRRREILERANIPFTVRAANVLEQHRPRESPSDYVLRLSLSKAEAVAKGEHEVVLGADTVVVAGESILEKPVDTGDARRMLGLLSGRNHQVITGIALRHANGTIRDVSVTQVRFAELDPEEIDAYVLSGEPMDKAGAYAIQGIASRFVESIEGCYFNVVGLPISLVFRHLKQLQKATAG